MSVSDVCEHGGLRRKCEICELRGRIAELEKALQTHGGHKEWCAALRGCPCSCGLSKLMVSVTK